jgi:NitT/TauT family transport system ATP-binding protein
MALLASPAPNGIGFVSGARSKLSIQAVSKRFQGSRGEVRALEEVSLDVKEGEFVCLVGPSGCGKSTLLNLIAGLDRPERGVILADDREVTGPGPDRLVMFQESALFPWLDVMDNVLFGLKRKRRTPRKELRDVAMHYLRLVGLERFAHASVHELSGGMKQRVALARALAPRPRVLLMDEPFAALDAMTREQLYGDLQRIWEECRKTIVFVTHNVREAVCLGDRVVLFSPHPGRIREQFTVDLPRERDINDVHLAEHAARITHALKSHAPPGPPGPGPAPLSVAQVPGWSLAVPGEAR